MVTTKTTIAISSPDRPLAGHVVAVDVQHLYRDGLHALDRGSRFALAGGGHVWEADCALHYATALAASLTSFGARVITNDPRSAFLIGPYSRRQAQAMALGADTYLACHLNAGGGSYGLAEVCVPFSRLLATTMLDALAEAVPAVSGIQIRDLKPGDRGAVCIRGFTRGPAVLLEPLFGDCPAHQPQLSLEGLTLVGEALARGVVARYVVPA